MIELVNYPREIIFAVSIAPIVAAESGHSLGAGAFINRRAT